MAPAQMATLVGLAILILIAAGVFFQTRGMRRELDGKLTALDAKLAQMSTKIEGQAQAAQQQRRGGPDPNRVYPVSVAGSPSKGPDNAPVTIAEFSDFQ
jgi:hypothetical protein